MRNLLRGLETTAPKLQGFYRGMVVDNQDKLQLGRIRVKVYPYFEDLNDDELPWAQPCWWMPMQIPPIKSWVWVFFEEGDPLKPVYLGQALPVGIRESLQVSTCVEGEQAGKQHMHPRTWFAETGIDYPDGYIIRTPNKFVFYVNDKTGEVRIQSDKAGKSHLHFKDNGDVHLWAGGNLHLRAAGNIYLDDPQAPEGWCGGSVSSATGSGGEKEITNPQGYPVETYEDYDTYTDMVSSDVNDVVLTASSNEEMIDGVKDVVKKYMEVESELGNQIVAKVKDMFVRLDFPINNDILSVAPYLGTDLSSLTSMPAIVMDQLSAMKTSALTSLLTMPLAKDILDGFQTAQSSYQFAAEMQNAVISVKRQIETVNGSMLLSLYSGYLSDAYIGQYFGKAIPSWTEEPYVSSLMSLGKVGAWFEIIKLNLLGDENVEV